MELRQVELEELDFYDRLIGQINKELQMLSSFQILGIIRSVCNDLESEVNTAIEKNRE